MRSDSLPWSSTSDGVQFSGRDGRVTFARDGVSLASADQVVVMPWSRIAGVRVAFPWTSVPRRRAENVFSALGPTFFLTPEDSTYVELLDALGEPFEIVRVQEKDPRKFDWRLSFAVEVGLDVLGASGELLRLADSRTWDALANEVARRVPLRSRFFRYLFDGLDSRFGGRETVRKAAVRHLLP